MKRVYLDHNATTPLRVEARDAMIDAMDRFGNPSSVHAEGRLAKSAIERARVQVADLVGCLPQQVVFTGSATEAAALAMRQKARFGDRFLALPTEHDCVLAWSDQALASVFDEEGALDAAGLPGLFDFVLSGVSTGWGAERAPVALVGMSGANSETGVMAMDGVVADHHINASTSGTVLHAVLCDVTQVAGKVPLSLNGEKRPAFAILSAHKFGGPKGVGALINLTAEDPEPLVIGGGQEMGRRAGTENVLGIIGFGAAAQAAKRDVDAGAWGDVEKLRNILETGVEALSKETIFVGNKVNRLPNTSCMLTPGWKGETQVMQMDLAGFAISAGSACSSGKVKASKVLTAMGYSEQDASCAIRVSLGLETTEDDILRFIEAWGEKLNKHKARAARALV